MTDVLGWRKKFGVLAPSTNTIVEPDFHAMTVPGVTSHTSRIHLRDQDLSSDEKMVRLLEAISEEMFFAIDRVMTAGVDYLIMAMSAETFWEGKAGNIEFIKRVEDYADVKVASCASAYQAALAAFQVNKIAAKPVIAVNAATWWYALRQNDIHDQVYGCGRLLREF
ncbi:hypothetical protein IQ244_24650 [Nostoc sp. LEGE 06077]|uniref:hypothetical protein n=1 Tax=Nostoc sp. LEGE 06077 TaxID=915325 RepID=UPI00187F49E5|nr:hypothetical protein [Nostoc sp. LEGE 06077]MBE9209628.1 hypothetical protein [Nostoc sp. LEGE 06077]